MAECCLPIFYCDNPCVLLPLEESCGMQKFNFLYLLKLIEELVRLLDELGDEIYMYKLKDN